MPCIILFDISAAFQLGLALLSLLLPIPVLPTHHWTSLPTDFWPSLALHCPALPCTAIQTYPLPTAFFLGLAMPCLVMSYLHPICLDLPFLSLLCFALPYQPFHVLALTYLQFPASHCLVHLSPVLTCLLFGYLALLCLTLPVPAWPTHHCTYLPMPRPTYSFWAFSHLSLYLLSPYCLCLLYHSLDFPGMACTLIALLWLHVRQDKARKRAVSKAKSSRQCKAK